MRIERFWLLHDGERLFHLLLPPAWGWDEAVALRVRHVGQARDGVKVVVGRQANGARHWRHHRIHHHVVGFAEGADKLIRPLKAVQIGNLAHAERAHTAWAAGICDQKQAAISAVIGEEIDRLLPVGMVERNIQFRGDEIKLNNSDDLPFSCRHGSK